MLTLFSSGWHSMFTVGCQAPSAAGVGSVDLIWYEHSCKTVTSVLFPEVCSLLSMTSPWQIPSVVWVFSFLPCAHHGLWDCCPSHFITIGCKKHHTALLF